MGKGLVREREVEAAVAEEEEEEAFSSAFMLKRQ